MSLRKVLATCVRAAQDKKAEEIVVLDLRKLSDVTDYFVICHGTSHRQVSAIADAIEERLARQLGLHPAHVEGQQQGEWVLLDYLDFVVHVFIEEKRTFYGLERLWGDAPRVRLPGTQPELPGASRRSGRPAASRG